MAMSRRKYNAEFYFSLKEHNCIAFFSNREKSLS